MATRTLERQERVAPVQDRALDARAGVWAGVIAGAVFLLLELIMVPLFMGGSPWGPPRMIAAIVMGEGVLPPPATFSLGVVLVAVLVHFPLSIGYALIGGLAAHRLSTTSAIVVGCVAGLVLYWINFYGFTALFPWFEMARSWVSVFAHIVFGGVVAGVYKALQSDRRLHEAAAVA